MPLKMNIGLSRKVGEANYGSRGASVNLEMEVDSGLVQEPAKLKERMRQLFTLVRSSLAEELNSNGNGHAPTDQPPTPPPANGSNGSSPTNHGNGQQPSPATNGHQPTNGQRQPGQRMATQSQIKAIQAICKRRQWSLPEILHSRYPSQRAEELTIQEASRLIDELKAS